MKLNNTYQPNTYYTTLGELSKSIQTEILSGDIIELDSLGSVGVEIEAEIEGTLYRVTLSLGDANAIRNAYVEDEGLGDDLGDLSTDERIQVEEYLDRIFEDMRGCIEDSNTVYLTDITE
jgi:hypothetical protein